MKKHLILTTSLFSLAALLLSNCSNTEAPLPTGGGASAKSIAIVSLSPTFNGTGSTTNELDNLT